jgi:hypothetical protein
MGDISGIAKTGTATDHAESTMRTQKMAPFIGLVLASSMALSACSSLPFGKRGSPPAGPDAAGGPEAGAEGAEGAKPPAPLDETGTEQVEAQAAPARRGFFSNLARTLGSESNTPNVGPCPAVRVLYDSQRFVDLAGPERFENVGYTGEIQNVQSSCRYIGSDPITVALVANMAFGKGPKAAPAGRDVVYWVAVTRKDVAPIARERYTMRVVVPEGQDRVRLSSPTIEVVIPRANAGVSGANFEVLVGFELSPEQLEFNRNGKRFRVDAGAGLPR